MLVLLSNLKLQKLWTQCIVKVEKAFNLWVKDTEIKPFLIDSIILCQEACEDSSKGPSAALTPGTE